MRIRWLWWVVWSAALCGSACRCDSGRPGLIGLLPSDAPAAVIFPDLARSLGHVRALKQKFSVGPVAMFIDKAHRELSAALGFDPLQLDNLEKLGLAPSRGLAVLPAPAGASVVILGVADGKTFEDTLRAKAGKLIAAEELNSTAISGVRVVDVGTRSGESQTIRFRYAFSDGYAWLAGPAVPPPELARLIRPDPSRSLASLPAFQGQSGALTHDILLVFKGEALRSLGFAAVPAWFANPSGLLSLDLSPTAIVLDLTAARPAAAGDGMSARLKPAPDGHLERLLPGNTLLAIKLCLSPEAWIQAGQFESLPTPVGALSDKISWLTGHVVAGLSTGDADQVNRMIQSLMSSERESVRETSGVQLFAWLALKPESAVAELARVLASALGAESQAAAEEGRTGSLTAIHLSGGKLAFDLGVLYKPGLLGLCAGTECTATAAQLVDGQQKGLLSRLTGDTAFMFGDQTLGVFYLDLARLRSAIGKLEPSKLGRTSLLTNLVLNLVTTAMDHLQEWTAVVRANEASVRFTSRLEIR